MENNNELLEYIKQHFRFNKTTMERYDIMFRDRCIGTIEKNKDTKKIKEWLENDSKNLL